MSDIPEAVLATAFDLVETMQSNKMDALTAGDARYANILTDDANAIARALMAAAKEADEGATKRERERAAKVALERHKAWETCHPDDADFGQVCDDISACADISAAILKGEA